LIDIASQSEPLARKQFHMKKSINTSLSIIYIFASVLLGTRSVLAHGDEPRIEINPERLNPGMVLDIRGVDFEFEEEVQLALIGSQTEIPLGTAAADTEGVFFLTVTLPVDLAEGAYVIRGTTDDHSVESPGLTIWGNAPSGEDSQRSEEDLLLAPMPTLAAGAPTPQMASISPAGNLPTAERSISYVWIAAGIGVVVLSLLVLKLRR
jgi:hypothetical protein